MDVLHRLSVVLPVLKTLLPKYDDQQKHSLIFVILDSYKNLEEDESQISDQADILV